MKKIFFIIIIAGLVIIIIFLIFSSLFTPKPQLLTEAEVFFPAIKKNDNLVFYDKEKLAFSKINQNEEISQFSLSHNAGEIVENVIWSPYQDKAIVKIGSQETEAITSWLYDFTNHKKSKLDENIFSTIKWSPDGKKIFYVYLTNHGRSIYKANPDGSNQEKIIDLSLAFDQIDLSISPDSKKIAFFDYAVGGENLNLYLIDTIDKNLQKITPEGFSSKPVWSSDSQRLFFEKMDPQTLKPSLWLWKNNNLKTLGLQTFSQKTIWKNNNTLMVAVPKEIPEDYLGREVRYQDQIYEYHLEKNTKKLIKGTKNLDLQNLMISQDEKTLYFTFNNRLYKLKVD